MKRSFKVRPKTINASTGWMVNHPGYDPIGAPAMPSERELAEWAQRDALVQSATRWIIFNGVGSELYDAESEYEVAAKIEQGKFPTASEVGMEVNGEIGDIFPIDWWMKNFGEPALGLSRESEYNGQTKGTPWWVVFNGVGSELYDAESAYEIATMIKQGKFPTAAEVGLEKQDKITDLFPIDLWMKKFGEPALRLSGKVQASEDIDRQNMIAHLGFNPWDDDDEYSSEWEQLETKQVRDSDGFLTEYTLYRNVATGQFGCVFGDRDLYRPDDGYFDFETENEDEAYEWFHSYEGIYDEDVYSSTEVSTPNFEYVLKHGFGPGTLPKDVEVVSHSEDGDKDIVLLDRKLTQQELDQYDIAPGRTSISIIE